MCPPQPWHDSYTCVTWLNVAIRRCILRHMFVLHNSNHRVMQIMQVLPQLAIQTSAPWLIQTCAPWLIQTCAPWCAPWLIQTCAPWLIQTCVQWLIQTCDTTGTYMSRDSIVQCTCCRKRLFGRSSHEHVHTATWLIHLYDVTQSYNAGVAAGGYSHGYVCWRCR